MKTTVFFTMLSVALTLSNIIHGTHLSYKQSLISCSTLNQSDTTDSSSRHKIPPPPPPFPTRDSDTLNNQTGKAELIPYEGPAFKGGDAGLKSFISSQLVYPAREKDQGIEGQVLIEFIVEKDGTTSKHKITKNIPKGDALGQEALRVCRLIKYDQSARQYGENVRMLITMPFNFKLFDSEWTNEGWTYKGGEIALQEFVESNLVFPPGELKKKRTAIYVIVQRLDAKGKVISNKFKLISGTQSKAFEKEVKRISKMINQYECPLNNTCETTLTKTILVEFDERAIERAEKK